MHRHTRAVDGVDELSMADLGGDYFIIWLTRKQCAGDSKSPEWQ